MIMNRRQRMIIFNSSFFGANNCFSPMPTNVSRINCVEISNAKFDDLYIGTDTSREQSFDIDSHWNETTIMYAPFDENLSAGNTSYTLNMTSDILIKRREKGQIKWTTLYRKKIDTIEDFNITFIDRFAASNKTYEYAIVGVLNGAEGAYNILDVESKFGGMFIVGKDEMYGTAFDIGECNTTRKHYLAKHELPSKKYPNSYSNSKVNYDYGTAEGFFVKNECKNGRGNIDAKNSFSYRNDIMDFLSDNNPKVLKLYDGRIWLISIDGESTDTADGHYLHRIIAFSWFESGDCNRERDLYDAGFIDVPIEFWGNNK